MQDYQIIPITEEYIDSFWAAVDAVAKEHKFLAFLEGPPIESTREFVRENIKGNWPHLIAINKNKVIGWCDITSLHRPIFAHSGVLGIGVLANYRHQGIGESLIRTALQQAKSMGLTRVELTVRENNKSAIALYEKIGFVKEGFHKNAVRIGNEYENDITMALLFE